MNKQLSFLTIIFLSSTFLFAQPLSPFGEGLGVRLKNDIPAVGIIKNISDSALLDIVQRQTFRYFWHYAHPVSGLARERDNTVRAEYYWDFINEAEDEPNLSKHTFGSEACAIGGTGFGILSTVVAVNRGMDWKRYCYKTIDKNC